jgi:hypothetical protein
MRCQHGAHGIEFAYDDTITARAKTALLRGELIYMRTTMRLFVVLAIAFSVVPAAVVSGQGLADVARAEAARRKNTKNPAKVYTNDTLRSDASAPRSSSDPQTPASPASSPAAAGASSDTQTPPVADVAATRKDEAYWKKRLTEARAALDRASTFGDALQSRINALNADFAARADPAQRAEIAASRQKALAELDRVRKEVQDGTKAIADIQEEGRKAGVPSGWLR